MPDRPLTESDRAASHQEPFLEDESLPKAEPFPTDESPSKDWWKASHWPTYAALAIAVIAAALAALAYFHPAHNSTPGVAQQGGDAKANVCGAFGIVRKAVVLNTHLQTSNDPFDQLSVAANARLALLGGGVYLQERLAANNAAPADLAAAVNSLASTVEQLGINYLAGATADALDPVRNSLNNELNQIDKLCA
jgi:hypothetical protein